jgi:hypothetical protein
VTAGDITTQPKQGRQAVPLDSISIPRLALDLVIFTSGVNNLFTIFFISNNFPLLIDQSFQGFKN